MLMPSPLVLCRRAGAWLVVSLVSLSLLLSLAWFSAGDLGVAHADSATRFVAPDGRDLYDCSSVAQRCRTVQRAVDVAAPFDEIRVAAGTYTSTTGPVVALSGTVTLLGGWSSDFTSRNPAVYPSVLDAQRKDRVVLVDAGAISPTIDGFVVTGGNAHWAWDWNGAGGGILSAWANPIIQNNVITNNIAYSGTAPWGEGGGLYVVGASSESQIRGNRIISNVASTTYYGLGGGLFLESSQARVVGNDISANAAGAMGGGVFLRQCNGLTLDGNRIISNTAGTDLGLGSLGGGVRVEFSGPFTLTNNVIADNFATSGGGVAILGQSAVPAFGHLINNTIARNTLGPGGEGIRLSYATILTLTNNIIVSQTVGIQSGSSTNVVRAGFTLFYGNSVADLGGSGVLISSDAIGGRDPLFVAPVGGDYHLSAGSPAIDAGDPAGVPPAPGWDMDGDHRPMGTRVDVGADEFVPRFVYLPLIQ